MRPGRPGKDSKQHCTPQEGCQLRLLITWFRWLMRGQRGEVERVMKWSGRNVDKMPRRYTRTPIRNLFLVQRRVEFWNEALMSMVLKKVPTPQAIGSLRVMQTWTRVNSPRAIGTRKPELKLRRRREEAQHTVLRAQEECKFGKRWITCGQ